MRRLWICHRRLRSSTFSCFLLLLGAAMLTITALIRDKPDVLGNDVKFQQNIVEPKIIYFKDAPQKKHWFSTKRYQHDLNHDSARQDNYVTVLDNDVIHLTQEYNQSMESVSTKDFTSRSTHFSSFEDDQHNSENVPQKTSSNIFTTFDRDKVQKLEKLTTSLLNLLNSQTPVHQREIISIILKHLRDSDPDSVHLLNLLSHDIPPPPSSLFVQVLDKLFPGKQLSRTLESQYIDSLKHIIANIQSFNKSHHTAYKDNVTSKGSKYILNNLSYESPRTTNDDHVNIRKIYTENISSNVRNNNSVAETEGGLNSNMSQSRFLPRVPQTKRMPRVWQKKKGWSRYGRKDNEYTFTRFVDGIYWSEAVEDSLPKGISNQAADEWIARSRLMEFKFLQNSTWNKCGRPKNAFALLIDGSETCVRYRSPHDRLVQGEIMSYWLARLLGLDNVPPVYLSYLNSSQWWGQKDQFQELGWAVEDYVAAIMWITEIDSRLEAHVFMPRLMLTAYRQKWAINISGWNVLDVITVDKDTGKQYRRPSLNITWEVISLAQWGSLIIFDYLTGNYDRVSSMQDGAEKEHKPSIIEEPIRNLRKSKNSKKIWLIDNESGLLDAYEMMYRSRVYGKRFLDFHDQMLQTMCIFQRHVVEALRELHKGGSAHKTLGKYAEMQEPLLTLIERESSYQLFEKYFHQRLETVVQWINYCEKFARYG